jgi:predicted RNA-binding Zn ribbon-like protein
MQCDALIRVARGEWIMERHTPDLQRLRLLAGKLALDFVNSVENPNGEQPEEFLTSYPSLVRWARHADLLDGAEEAALLALGESDGAAARATLAQALSLREALHRTFLAIATRRGPERADLEQVQAVYSRAVAGGRLIPNVGWDWRPVEPQLEQLLWPVAHSAIELLTGGELERIKVCENPYGCGWLFFDGSKNKGRRWCSMEGCGSQVKMRRYYAKRRSST